MKTSLQAPFSSYKIRKLGINEKVKSFDCGDADLNARRYWRLHTCLRLKTTRRMNISPPTSVWQTTVWRLEYIPEPEVQVNGVHGKGDSFEILSEDVIQSPREVGVYGKVFVCTPRASHLQSPLEAAEVFRKVVGGNVVTGKVYAASRRIGGA